MKKKYYNEYMKREECPVCRGKDCWDLDNNNHTGDRDEMIYSCKCGAVWIETWKLTNVTVMEPKFYKDSVK